MGVRGIRGATTVPRNEPEEIRSAVRELIFAIVQENDLKPDEIASITITSTPDLNAAYPASAIRTLPNWELVPIIGACELDVPGSLPRCIRLMILVNTDKSPQEIRHVYLNEAISLRPDLAEKNVIDK
ncbi:chorismate mutase [Thermoflavimicrobium dichotomicum]|uniref:chorismate mutase n=1 Tax=Thermoflavimicrobium dichotomicum TaxID=46223 RepID=A0A1I3SLB4_9BACL|nr:chorismate mutase [Thermoflavimicrobium dichotomicum]SFJ58401.1 chorismate mutase [Thermoflavimicrobium dichotomicum]